MGLFLTRYPRPTLRGEHILDRLLCTRVPPPPPNVDQALGPGATPRERITASTSQNPACGACHQLIDPIGFALDGFDDQSHVTGFDSSGSLTLDSKPVAVANPSGLGQAIAGSRAGQRCAALRYAEYALDREIDIDASTGLPIEGNAGDGPPPLPIPRPEPTQEFFECAALPFQSGQSLQRVAEMIVTSAGFRKPQGAPHRIVAFDTSADPIEHALQETSQFRDVFGEALDEQIVEQYVDALRGVEQQDSLALPPSEGGAGGEAAGGAADAGGEPTGGAGGAG